MKIAIINCNDSSLHVGEIPKESILDENGDYCEEKIVNVFNHKYGLYLKLSEISWGEINTINIY